MQLTPEMIERIALWISTSFDIISKESGAHGVGLGKKMVQNKEVDALVFFVQKKRTEDELQALGLAPIPQNVEVTVDETNGLIAFPTLVVETPLMTFRNSRDNCQSHDRPARGGTCISAKDSQEFGTFGAAIMNKELSDRNVYILSCAHVLSGKNQYPINWPEQQPEGGEELARLYKSVTFPATSAVHLASDSALAITNRKMATSGIWDIPDLEGTLQTLPNPGAIVQKSGASTNLTKGTVLEIVATLTVEGYVFDNVIITTSITEQGDSGAILVNEDGKKAIGLLFCGNGKYSGANPIKQVEDDLGIAGWRWKW